MFDRPDQRASFVYFEARFDQWEGSHALPMGNVFDLFQKNLDFNPYNFSQELHRDSGPGAFDRSRQAASSDI